MRNLMNKSLKNRIIKSFLIVFITVFILFAMIVLIVNIKIFKKQSYNYCKKIVEDNIIIIDNYFEQAKTISSIVATDKDIINAVRYRNSIEKIDYKIELYNQWKVEDKISQLDVFGNITNATIVGKSGEYLYFYGDKQDKNYNFYEQEWFNKKINSFSSNVKFTNIHDTNYLLNKKGEETVSIITPMIDFSNFYKNIKGYLICDIDINPILSNNNKSNTQITIFNGINPIYFPMSSSLSKGQQSQLQKEIQKNTSSFIINKDKENDNSYIVVNEKSNITGWSIIGFRTLKDVESIQMSISLFMIILIIISIILSIFLYVLISDSVLIPINKLVKKFNKISDGNFNVKFENSSITEINTLSTTADNMVKNIVNLSEEVVKEHERVSEAQLMALQHQINPHFLNNVLQSIKALAVCEDVKAISTMTTLLGKILSYSIYNPYDKVTVFEELTYVENYMKLQKIRYHDKFSYEINYEDEVKYIKLPKLVIQPIVENAIEHGISSRNKLHIIVSAVKEDDNIKITIHDNGVGIDKNQLDQLNKKLENATSYSEKKSIGLLNVNDRIKSIYKDKYSLRITSVRNERTIVELKIII